jgi:hypothetical protein
VCSWYAFCVKVDVGSVAGNCSQVTSVKLQLYNFMIAPSTNLHILYGPSKMSIRTMFPGFYVILCGLHKDVKSAFFCSYSLRAVQYSKRKISCMHHH